jgi:hypothetical protein
MMKMKRLMILAALTLLVVTPAAAQTTSNGDAWKVTFAPYLMGAGMSGTAAIAGQEVTVDVSPSDIFSHLQFGAMGVVAARKGKWGVLGDFIWMALGATSDTPPANIDPNQGAFSFYGARRLSPVAEVTFGMRWNVLQGQIGFKGPAGRVFKETKQWVDPVVGLNLRSNGSGRLHGGLYTDIGGFGAGSKFAWQLFPTIGIDVGKRASVEFGYRWLDMNYESGEGLTFFKYDVLTQGPVMGFVFKF